MPVDHVPKTTLLLDDWLLLAVSEEGWRQGECIDDSDGMRANPAHYQKWMNECVQSGPAGDQAVAPCQHAPFRWRSVTVCTPVSSFARRGRLMEEFRYPSGQYGAD
jgi:hypothetical protein